METLNAPALVPTSQVSGTISTGQPKAAMTAPGSVPGAPPPPAGPTLPEPEWSDTVPVSSVPDVKAVAKAFGSSAWKEAG